ncbi:hypothetical protein C0J52_23916, partial [Blattella germanica]
HSRHDHGSRYIWKWLEATLPYPTVWLHCTGKKPLGNGKLPKFRIQCATEDMYEEILNYMCNIFSREEHLSASMKIADDPIAVKEARAIWMKYLKMNISVVALLEDDEILNPNKSSRIVGFNILGISKKTDPKFTSDMVETETTGPVMRFIFDFALKDVDIFEMYGVDEYMSALGLFVHPDFRGQGLAYHLIRARFPLAKALGIKATMTYFTPIAAQVAAERAGMKVIKEAVYEEYEENGKVMFPNKNNRAMKGKKPMADGKIPKFRIQDVTEDMYEEIVAMRVVDDPVSIKDYEGMFRKYLKYNITVVAVVENDDSQETEKRGRIAGCNILGVTRKTDPQMTSDMFKGKASGPCARFVVDFGLKDVDIFNLYGVEEYMSAFGLFVHPDFRGQGLAVHLLKARFPLAKALGLKATMTFFSPVAAQVASVKAGMELIKEVVYEDYKEDGKVVFPNIKNRSMKIMGARIE